MKKMVGVINLDSECHNFQDLELFRNSASIPFGGRYRLIDFTLSNLVNSDITEVAIFIRNKFRSLLDHLGTGENWDLDRRHGGLFILPPDWNDPNDISKGDLQFFYNNRDFFIRSRSNYVLISGSQFIANTDYKEAFQFHIDRNADVTLVSVQTEELTSDLDPYFRIHADDLGWVQEISNDKRNPLIFTGVYIISKELLLDLVDECIAYGKENFFRDGIKEKINGLKVQTYRYRGYHAFVNSVESYYRHNLNLLKEDAYRQLFYKKHRIRTKASNMQPAKYEKNADVKHSILSDGCIVNGSVEKSILFKGVKVKEGATIKNSIVMQYATIEAGAYLENVIIDKDVRITRGQRLIGSGEKPFVVKKREVL